MIIFTGDNHEEVFLTGGSLGQILHDVPVALNQLLHLVITIIFLWFLLVFVFAALLVSLLLTVFLLLGSFLMKGPDKMHVFCYFNTCKYIVRLKLQFEVPLRIRCWRAVCPSRRRSWPDPSTAGTPSTGRRRWTKSGRFLWSGCWRRNS